MLVKLWMRSCDLVPFLLPHEESIWVTWGFVNDLRPPIERALEATNLVVALKSHFVFDLFVDLVANVNAPVDRKDHHIHVLEFCEQNLTLCKSDRL